MLKGNPLMSMLSAFLLISVAVEAWELVTPDHEVTYSKYSNVAVHLTSDPTYEGALVTFSMREDHLAQNLDDGTIYRSEQATCDSYGSAYTIIDNPTGGWPSLPDNTKAMHVDAIATVAGSKVIDIQNVNIESVPY